MTSFHDPYPDLPLFVDVGGERYYLGSEKPVELAYKGRAEFLKAFPTRKNAALTSEYLLRRHFPLQRGTFQFTYPGEREALIAVLEQRIQQLKESSAFSGSILKNSLLQRVSLQLQEILVELRGAKGTDKGADKGTDKGRNNKGTDEADGSSDSDAGGKTPESVVRGPAPSLSEDQLLSLLLEVTWYLLYPERVPARLQAEWSAMLKDMDRLRLGDLMTQIRSLQQTRNGHSPLGPRNYFTDNGVNPMKVNEEAGAPQTAGGANQNALDKAVEFSTHIDNTVAREDAEKRVKALLHILQAKKYLNNTFQFDESLMNVMDVSTALPSVQKSLLRNVIQDDKSKKLDRPLSAAMAPLFDYFSAMFDPVYGFLRDGIKTYLDKMDYASRPHVIPPLLTLLHVFQTIRPSESGEGGQNLYGVYELTGADPELVTFVRALLQHTRGTVETIRQNETALGIFRRQIAALPNVRLSFAAQKRGLLSNPKEDAAAALQHPYITLAMVGENLTIPDLDHYLRKPDPKLPESLHKEMADFFQPDRLYLLIAKSDTEEVPVNLQRVDMREVTVETDPLPVERVIFQDKDDITFVKNKELSLGDLVDVDSSVICTSPEILLSLLIAFQERIPQ